MVHQNIMKPLDPTRVAAQLSRHPQHTRSARELRPDPREETGAADREAYGKKPWGARPRAAFYQFLPESPRGAYLGRDDARRYVMHIDRVLEMDRWTARERETLRQKRVKWVARAEGKDPRYLAVGAQGGINEKYRKKTAADIITAMYQAIADSRALLDGSQVRVVPTQKFVNDPKWPLGRPNPGRRA